MNRLRKHTPVSHVALTDIAGLLVQAITHNLQMDSALLVNVFHDAFRGTERRLRQYATQD